MAKNWIKITLLGISVLGSTCLWGDENYYRFKDKEGKTVITNALPEDMGNVGYEIISPRGNVIQTIAPPKTVDEIAAETKTLEKQKAAEQQAETDKKAKEYQAQKDEILLKSFTNEADIIRSRDEKIASLAILEGIVRDNLARLQKQLIDTQNARQTYLDQKQPVPENIQKTIIDTQRQINENEAFLETKKNEKQQINTNYQKLIDRFQQIQSHPTQTQ